MSDKEILEKAITKAIDSGYSDIVTDGVEVLSVDEFGEWLKLKIVGKLQGYYNVAIFQLIFNHDFAKALWGDYPESPEHNWAFHLQQMVIADDPIKYLGDNLPT